MNKNQLTIQQLYDKLGEILEMHPLSGRALVETSPDESASYMVLTDVSFDGKHNLLDITLEPLKL